MHVKNKHRRTCRRYYKPFKFAVVTNDDFKADREGCARTGNSPRVENLAVYKRREGLLMISCKNQTFMTFLVYDLCDKLVKLAESVPSCFRVNDGERSLGEC